MRILSSGAALVCGACLVGGVRAADFFDPTTGGLHGLSQRDGRRVTTSFRNVYHLMAKSGDAEGTEDEDRVVGRETLGVTSVVRCVNERLPGLMIEKRYVREGAMVRRFTTFVGERDEPTFVRFETEGHFEPAFMEKVWYLGAGYIGPHKPYPHKPAPQEMNWYVQSTKGLVFTNPENDRGAFAHWRVKIDGTPVLPWWHSTINTYREKADRLWFLPDGYRMCLGTYGVMRGKPVTVEDRFDVFDGDVYAFFDLFAAEPAVRDELASIPAAQPWVDDLLAVVQSGSLDYYRYLSEMEPTLPVLGMQSTMGNWGDYRPEAGAWTGNYGGTILTNEVSEYLTRLKGLSPTIRHCFYQIVISAGERTRVVAERPEWFRRHDRQGRDDSLFPGDQNNWQTMFSRPAVREFLVESTSDFADFCHADAIYNDEAQMTNAIDWDRMCVTRDDDAVKYWRALRTRAAADKRALYFNGSGNPYAELNCMESPHELKPDRWRDWVGVAWGIGMMNRLKPGNRTVLLYWRDGLDYVNRVLALGWLPYPAQSVRMYPLDAMRAAHQSGNLWPVALDYAPDWKKDRWTEIESHAVKRPDGPDTLLSFINRTAVTTNVSVRVSLASLGWKPKTPINVWMLTPRPKPEKGTRYMLSDAEVRENWRARGLNAGGTFLDKRLLWSGTYAGTFETTLEDVAPNDMRQLLLVPGRLAFYAIEDRPCDYPYVTDRRGRIDGGTVEMSAPADLVLACADADCSDVTVNGKAVSWRRISIAGRNVTLVSVPAGRSTVAWSEGPVDPAEPLAPDPVSLSGPPSRVAWNRDRFVPARRELTGAQVSLPNFRISARGTYHSAWSDFLGLQAGLEPGVAIADATNRTLTVGTSRREGGYDYPSVHTWAGFEICYAKDLRIDYEQTFGTVNSVMRGHTGKGWQGQEKNFVGFVVDYRVRGKYVRRVLYRMDGRTEKIVLGEPDWGKKNAQADEIVDLGNLIGGAASGQIRLHLADHAPEGWDGVVFLSAGVTRVWPNRRLTLKVSPASPIRMSDRAAAEFETPIAENVRGRENTEWSIWYGFHLTDKLRGRPNVLLIGDSICNGYQEGVRKILDDVANCSYWVSSYSVSSPSFWRHLDLALDDRTYKVVHVSNGAHSRSASDDEYCAGLRRLIGRIREKQPQARIVWQRCTPARTPDLDVDIQRLNGLADKTMLESGVTAQTDLYALMNALDRQVSWRDTWHFTPSAVSMQSKAVASSVLKALGRQENDLPHRHGSSELLALDLTMATAACGSVPAGRTDRPAPRATQSLRIREGIEVYGIVHWGLNTYMDREWGFGDENPADLAPAKFDADQIVGACKAGGLQGLIVVAKHHDGFCLWPTKTTDHNISKSPFRDGKGDYVKEMERACRKYGLKFGVYVSPWDRNSALYGSERYVTDVFQAQIRELLSGDYGEIFEMWFDGANGGDGYYGGAREKRKIPPGYYRYETETFAMVRKLQSAVCIFNESDLADFRFGGNERGLVDPDSRSTGGHYDGVWDNYKKWANTGLVDGTTFHPIEADFPLRPGWFYHAKERGKTKCAVYLMQRYLATVGNAATLNLGIAPNRDGLLDEEDVKALKGFGDLRKLFFAKEAKDGERFNVVVMTEDVSAGELVDAWTLTADGKELLSGRSIGIKRIRVLDAPVAADAVAVKAISTVGKPGRVSLARYLVTPEVVKAVLAATTESGETDTAKWMTTGVGKE